MTSPKTQTQNPKPQHGGRRPGAGRKSSDPNGTLRRYSFRLSQYHARRLAVIGNGSRVRGLRTLIDDASTPPNPTPHRPTTVHPGRHREAGPDQSHA